MKLFFFCSTPAMGFKLKEFEAESGENTGLNEEEVRARMRPESFALMTRDGCKMALFFAGGALCFVANDLATRKPDQYGNRKHFSLAFEMEDGDSIVLRRMAAFAVLNRLAFTEKIADCVSVSYGEEGYSLIAENLRDFFRFFEQPLAFSEKGNTRPRKHLWNHIILEEVPEEKQKNYFLYLVREMSIDYISRSTKIEITEVLFPIPVHYVEEWEKNPPRIGENADEPTEVADSAPVPPEETVPVL